MYIVTALPFQGWELFKLVGSRLKDEHFIERRGEMEKSEYVKKIMGFYSCKFDD